MRYRKKMSFGRSQRRFKRGQAVHFLNSAQLAMRGGTRL